MSARGTVHGASVRVTSLQHPKRSISISYFGVDIGRPSNDAHCKGSMPMSQTAVWINEQCARRPHLRAAVLPAGMSVPSALKAGAAPLAGCVTLSFTCGGRCATTSRAFSANAASPGELPAVSSCIQQRNLEHECADAALAATRDKDGMAPGMLYCPDDSEQPACIQNVHMAIVTACFVCQCSQAGRHSHDL